MLSYSKYRRLGLQWRNLLRVAFELNNSSNLGISRKPKKNKLTAKEWSGSTSTSKLNHTFKRYGEINFWVTIKDACWNYWDILRQIHKDFEKIAGKIFRILKKVIWILHGNCENRKFRISLENFTEYKLKKLIILRRKFEKILRSWETNSKIFMLFCR